MIDSRRWPRVSQKTADCRVEGCKDSCVGNDLCAKHGMARHRLTEKGRAQIKRYNKRYKRPDIDKECIHCKKMFVTAREAQELCGGCSKMHSAYYATKKFREKKT